jgi:hypothetical protein
MVARIASKVALFATLLGAVGVANAVPVTWDDWAGTPTTVTQGSTYSYSHDITDGAGGYRPGIDSISDASLLIFLADDAPGGDFWLGGDAQETVGFSFDGGVWTSTVVDTLLWIPELFDFSVTKLLSDGRLDVSITSYSGDFVFDGSYLTASGNRAPAPVPEPATLSMFGFAVLMMGLALRRRRAR